MKRLNSGIASALARKFRIENGMSLTEAINLKSLLLKLNILTIFIGGKNEMYKND